MSDEEIEKIIEKEFGDVLNITDEEIKKMSFLESCEYIEKLNLIQTRMDHLKEN